MASFLDYCGFNTPEKTLLPRLRIHSSTFELQSKSETYFQIPETALADDGNELAIFIQENFTTSKAEHTNFMNSCTTNYEKNAALLYDLDKKIISSLLVAVVASSLSVLPILGWLAVAGTFAALYFSMQRGALYEEQQESLKLLVGVCNWSIGPGPNVRTDTKQNLVECEAIQRMMDQLTILDETQTKHFLADDIQAHFLGLLATSYNSFRFFSKSNDAALVSKAHVPRPALEQVALKQRAAEFNRCIYGLNKGTEKDFIDAFLSALPDLWQAMKNTWTASFVPVPTVSPA